MSSLGGATAEQGPRWKPASGNPLPAMRVSEWNPTASASARTQTISRVSGDTGLEKELATTPAIRQIRGMPDPSTIIFDLDDTLIETTPVYNGILEQFAQEVVRLFPDVDRTLVRELQDEIDIRAAESMGFAKDRFPWSLAETYRVLAQRRGAVTDGHVEQRLTALGYSVFDRAPEMVEGARELLLDLEGKAELILYTLGVPEVQRVKIEFHALERVFDEVHIVPRKSVDALRAVVGARSPGQVMVVGDSLRGEVGPAVELGCRAVLVRRKDSWRYHHAEVRGPYDAVDRLVELRSLLELPAVRESA